MYGMVHRAARQMVLELHGEDQWTSILGASGLGDEAFISANVYDDAVTFNLIEALSRHCDTPVESILRAFGEYWISFAYQGDYRAMMTMAGHDLVSFLNNLNRMHDSIQVSIPGARLPTFLVEKATDADIEIAYFSDRKGLEPFVEGLLLGLMKHFNRDGQVRQLGDSGRGILFQIELSPQ